ncbi:high-affinity Zn(2+) transporter zrt1 [Aspergillus alliaceus]|uniref:High-affinity Zn(2+) transporter zrt1 n=1 Tax=Petromyces alliaceus TaxID=209559 RepID=A0A5N6FW82_PETAA|nr:Zinc/iron permease [Aspergillus alliaceus]KAB8234208.1 Zinc/iron permease [Aspergillus alliaceus]KAE8394438.1 Zinc/iron permease [Aspergillus alliaceus]KAF5857279.1 high-affinity Zn(2+) transporter zrt1 [Aspergillus burnettii]
MSSFNPNNVDLDTVDPVDVICYLNASENGYDGRLGARISAIFVILIVSTAVTFFPVIAKRVPRLHIPLYVYLFARYFGAGVIVATAFIHLLDPAYDEIGPASCVGMTGNWGDYSWCPAIVLASLIAIFLLDFGAERYVEVKYGICREDPEPIMTSTASNHMAPVAKGNQALEKKEAALESQSVDESFVDRSFKQQIAAFLVLEFGVIFHSVIIGLNLGVTGEEFSTLYPVLVFHQSFEGLGIGARMSAIPFRKGSWLPWILCSLYGLTTPISIAIGLGVRTTYNSGSYTANVVSGVLDAISAGILIYTGLVELLARDFLFDPHRTRDNKRLTFMVISMLLGAGVMALLGKWA